MQFHFEDVKNPFSPLSLMYWEFKFLLFAFFTYFCLIIEKTIILTNDFESQTKFVIQPAGQLY